MSFVGGGSRSASFTQQDDAVIMNVYAREAAKNGDLLAAILQVTPESLGLAPDTERGLPGEKIHKDSGWTHVMLSRYVFAGTMFCRNKRVAELCSGLGWGAAILSRYAAKVECLELCGEALRAAKRAFAADNIVWNVGDVLQAGEYLAPGSPGSFDAVSAMEVIEHFTLSGGRLLLESAASLLRPGGVFVASSYYPDTEEEAERVCAGNPHHPHIFTKQELASLAADLFREPLFFGNRLFVARKKEGQL